MILGLFIYLFILDFGLHLKKSGRVQLELPRWPKLLISCPHQVTESEVWQTLSFSSLAVSLQRNWLMCSFFTRAFTRVFAGFQLHFLANGPRKGRKRPRSQQISSFTRFRYFYDMFYFMLITLKENYSHEPVSAKTFQQSFIL